MKKRLSAKNQIVKNGLSLSEKIFLGLFVVVLTAILIFVFYFFQNLSKSQPVCKIQYLTLKENIPSYEYLKSITVYIEGCSGNIDPDEKLSQPIQEDEGGMCWSGTGSIIKIINNDTYILTNAHVAGRGSENPILFVLNDQHKVRAKLIAYDKYVDLAVLKVPIRLKDKSAIKGIATTHIQDKVFAVGNPLGVKYVYSEGWMAGYKGISLLMQLPLIYGNSGTAIVNADGYLIGVCYAVETYPGWIGIPQARITHTLAVDSINIQLFLESLGLYNENE